MTPTIRKTLAHELRDTRITRALALPTVATALGVSAAALRNWEAAASPMPEEVILRYAKYLGASGVDAAGTVVWAREEQEPPKPCHAQPPLLENAAKT